MVTTGLMLYVSGVVATSTSTAAVDFTAADAVVVKSSAGFVL